MAHSLPTELAAIGSFLTAVPTEPAEIGLEPATSAATVTVEAPPAEAFTRGISFIIKKTGSDTSFKKDYCDRSIIQSDASGLVSTHLTGKAAGRVAVLL